MPLKEVPNLTRLPNPADVINVDRTGKRPQDIFVEAKNNRIPGLDTRRSTSVLAYAEGDASEADKALKEGLANKDPEKLRESAAANEQHMQTQRRLAEQLNEQPVPGNFPIGTDADKKTKKEEEK